MWHTEILNWSRFVTTDGYVLKHLFASVLGIVFQIFGTFALGAFLTRSRAGRMGLAAMVMTVLGSALLLTIGGVSTFSAPEEGQAVLAGMEEIGELPTILASTLQTATFRVSVLLGFVGNVLVGVALWDPAKVGRSPLGVRARVDVHLRARVRDDDRRQRHRADGARRRGAGGDKGSVNGVERPEPALCCPGGGSSGAAECTMTTA